MRGATRQRLTNDLRKNRQRTDRHLDNLRHEENLLRGDLLIDSAVLANKRVSRILQAHAQKDCHLEAHPAPRIGDVDEYNLGQAQS